MSRIARDFLIAALALLIVEGVLRVINGTFSPFILGLAAGSAIIGVVATYVTRHPTSSSSAT